MTMVQVLDIAIGEPNSILTAPIRLDTLPLPHLLTACRDQLGRFRRGAESDARFGLELFRRAIDAQDPDAWHALIELYRPLLLARLLQQGIAPDLAEDAVQEAFVALWSKSDSGAVSTCEHTLAQVLNYLWGSVRFALIKLRRQQHDIPLAAEREPPPLLIATGSETVEQTFDARRALARIRTLVTAHEWWILWLRFGQELPPREIATRLGIPVADIHTTLASAKRRLRNDPQLRRFVEVDGEV